MRVILQENVSIFDIFGCVPHSVLHAESWLSCWCALWIVLFIRSWSHTYHRSAINIQINRSGIDVKSYVKLGVYVYEDDWNKNHQAHQIPVFIYSLSLCLLRWFYYFFLSTSMAKKKTARKKHPYEIFRENAFELRRIPIYLKQT